MPAILNETSPVGAKADRARHVGTLDDQILP